MELPLTKQLLQDDRKRKVAKTKTILARSKRWWRFNHMWPSEAYEFQMNNWDIERIDKMLADIDRMERTTAELERRRKEDV